MHADFKYFYFVGCSETGHQKHNTSQTVGFGMRLDLKESKWKVKASSTSKALLYEQSITTLL